MYIFGIYENVTENPPRLVGYIAQYSLEGSSFGIFSYAYDYKRRYFPHYAVHPHKGIDWK